MSRTRLRIAALAFSLAGCAQDLNGILAVEGSGTLLDPPAIRGDAMAEVHSLCGEGMEPGGHLVRMPYVQSVGSERARVSWTTTGETGETLELWAPGDEEATVLDAEVEPTTYLAGARQLGVALEGLEPASTHCYQLRDPTGNVVYGPTGFRTAPLAGEGVASIVVFGDSGGGNDDQAAVAAQLSTVPIDLVLHTGDLAYPNGTLDELQANHFAMYAELMGSVPFFTSLGDHDVATDGGGPYREVFTLPESAGGGEHWYSLDWGPVHVVVLDSNGRLEEQRAFLEEDLAASDAPWTIVVSSTPFYSSGFHGGSSTIREAFEDVLVAGGVDLVLSGDDHDYERTAPIDGVTYVVTGGGGRSVREVGSSWFTEFSATAFHFLSIDATPDHLRIHAIDATGREFDGVELTP